MPFLVEIRVHPSYETVPEDVRGEHIAFLDSHLDRVLAGGGLFDDTSEKILGGIYILDVEERAVAERIAAEDPYVTANVFEITRIVRWRKAYFDHERLVE